MVSLQLDKPHYHRLDTSLFHCPFAGEPYPVVDDPAITAGELWLWRPPSLSYVVQLQKQIYALREQIVAAERELMEALSGFRQEARAITLPLEVDGRFPARMVEEIDAPFYFSGNEDEE